MMAQLPMDQVRTLLAAVDEGTFDAAAQALHVTPSAVSQRVKALEQRIGRVLLARTKPIGLTESGEVLVRYARQLVQLEADAAAELGLHDASTPTRLAVAVNADSLATWFLSALASVPDELRIGFEVHREDQERTAELLSRGRVAAAVTSSAVAVSGCSVQPLGVMSYRASASRAFVERWLAGRPLAEALPQAPVVVFDRNDDLQDAFLRELAADARAPAPAPAPAGQRGPAPMPAHTHTQTQTRHQIPTSEAYINAVASGLGWGMIPDEQAAQLPPGSLVDLKPGRVVDVPLYWQHWKLDSPALAALTSAVTGAAQALSPASLRPTRSSSHACSGSAARR